MPPRVWLAVVPGFPSNGTGHLHQNEQHTVHLLECVTCAAYLRTHPQQSSGHRLPALVGPLEVLHLPGPVQQW